MKKTVFCYYVNIAFTQGAGCFTFSVGDMFKNFPAMFYLLRQKRKTFMLIRVANAMGHRHIC
ncbi:hypothetical protein CIG19_10340 [Enterobacterales bacterium CwR94]|nr:hypothetical protein CIG19_10340 [Enterobacterales bacterium CwR94]